MRVCVLQRIDEFQHKYDKVLNDLENVHVLLLEYKAVRAADAAYAVQHCAAAHVEVLRTIEAIISNGMYAMKRIRTDTHTHTYTLQYPTPDTKLTRSRKCFKNYYHVRILQSCTQKAHQHC